MLPDAFLSEIRTLLGDELPAFERALDAPPTLAMRVNPLRGNMLPMAEAFIESPVPWAADGWYLRPDARPGRSLQHDLGAFYLQEASAMVSAAVLDARPGERILDLCAAPGGKSSQIAFAMRGQGLLVSNEPVPSRAKILAENLDRLGIVNAVATCAYPDRLSARWPETFDAILVDAPCSGEGMFRREPASRDEWNPKSPEGCARRQAEILDEAAKMLRPGGRLIYSTCTFNHFENEGSILTFLSRHPDFEPCDFELPGIGPSAGGMLRVWPHRVRGDGHFVAKLVKSGSAPIPSPGKPESSRRKPPKPARTVSEESPEQLLARLEAETCRIPECLRGGQLIRQGDYVHLLPRETPSLDGIRTARPGLCLMRVGRSHVQPMPALAMAAGIHPLRTAEVTEDGARRILSGERIPLDSPEKGWHLAQWRGLPVAFLKNTR